MVFRKGTKSETERYGTLRSVLVIAPLHACYDVDNT